MSDPYAMTVLGPVTSAELGITLIHEHLHMDATPLLSVHGYAGKAGRPFDAAAAAEARWNPGSHPDNYRFIEDDLVISELRPYEAAGGRTVVELTPPALGRDPLALRRIARESQLNVIMGAGHYLHQTHDSEVRARSEEELAQALIDEARRGVGDSGIRPGIVGEIGTSVPVQQSELRVVRAAARAARAAGLAVSIHLHPWGRTGIEVADALLGEGLAPERIVLGHMTTAHDDAGYLKALLDRGVLLAFDLFGFDHSLIGLGRWPPSDLDVAGTIAGLVGQGYGRQIMISHDIGVRTRLRAYGGWGYAHILEHVLPLLRERGLDDSALKQLLVDNPARVLSVAQAG